MHCTLSKPWPLFVKVIMGGQNDTRYIPSPQRALSRNMLATTYESEYKIMHDSEYIIIRICSTHTHTSTNWIHIQHSRAFTEVKARYGATYIDTHVYMCIMHDIHTRRVSTLTHKDLHPHMYIQAQGSKRTNEALTFKIMWWNSNFAKCMQTINLHK